MSSDPACAADHPDAALQTAVAASLAAIRARVEAAALACGRDPASVQVTAVAKTQSRATLRAAWLAGQGLFGENRVQEGQGHWRGWPQEQARPLPQLRLIGPLQTNKARDAVALFDAIETLDRPSLVEALARAMDREGRAPRLLVQVNTGAEPQKAGVLPSALPQLLRQARDAGLGVQGLMCIPPAQDDPRPHFTQLAALARDHGLAELSMGMSSDFEAAIACGATHVRIGSALFGAR
jgi:hypothetical protein